MTILVEVRKFQSSTQSPLRSSSTKTLHMLTIPMAMQATLIQTAAMSVADLGEGPNIFRPNWEKRKKFFWDRASHLSQGLDDCPPSSPPPPPALSECLDLPLHVVHLCICHPLELPFVMENRLDRDPPLKFDIWHSVAAGVEWRADGGGGHSYSKTPLPIEKGIWRLNARCVRFVFAFSQLSTIIVC